MEGSGWRKALYIAGGAAATAGLLWYLLRDGPEDEEAEAEADAGAIGGHGNGVLFKVTDPKCCSIGIREEPDVHSRRTGRSLFPGEVFTVADVLPTESEQRYLLLADGRGWAFTHSSRDGRLLAQEVSEEEAMASASGMEAMMQEAHRLLESDPALREKVLSSPAVQSMMANPGSLQSMAESSPVVLEALDRQPELRQALAGDAAALGGKLTEAVAKAAAAP